MNIHYKWVYKKQAKYVKESLRHILLRSRFIMMCMLMQYNVMPLKIRDFGDCWYRQNFCIGNSQFKYLMTFLFLKSGLLWDMLKWENMCRWRKESFQTSKEDAYVVRGCSPDVHTLFFPGWKYILPFMCEHSLSNRMYY